jgi:hypothetical protein
MRSAPGAIQAAEELGARAATMLGQCLRGWAAARPVRRPDAQVEVRGAEGDRQIAIEEPHMRQRMQRLELPGRALNDRPKDDFVPLGLGELAQHPLEHGLIGRQRENLDDVPIFVGDVLGHNGRLWQACGGVFQHPRRTIRHYHSMPSSPSF